MKTSSDITAASRRPVAAAAAAATVDIFKVLFSSPVVVGSIYHSGLSHNIARALCANVRLPVCVYVRVCLPDSPSAPSSLPLSRCKPQQAPASTAKLSRHQTGLGHSQV